MQRTFSYLKKIKPEIQIFDETWLKQTHPFYTENFVTMQFLFDKKEQVREDNLLNSFLLNDDIIFFFLIFALLSFLFSVFLNFKFNFVKGLIRVLKRNIIGFNFELDARRSAKGIFILFYSLQLWLVMNLVTNNIQVIIQEVD